MTASENPGPTEVVHYPFAFDEYRDHRYETVAAESAAAAVIAALTRLLGGRVESWPGDRGKHRTSVDARLVEFAFIEQTCSLVWVGHGRPKRQKAVVVVPGEPESGSDSFLQPGDLAEHLLDQGDRRGSRGDAWTLVIVEACGAGRFVELLAAELDKAGDADGIALVGVGTSDGWGHVGTAQQVLGQVVAALSQNDTDISVSAVLDQIGRRLRVGQRGVVRSLGISHCSIRRPGIPLAATLDVYARLQAALQQLPEHERSHFARKGMGADFGEFTWSFVGRQQERRRIVEHLSAGNGILAVTGPAGSGKSAVLGNVLLRARPKVRDLLIKAGLLDNDPVTERERGLTIDGVLHATGMTHDDVAESLATLLGTDLWSADKNETPPTGGELANRLVAAVEADHRRRPIVVDALDEARDPPGVARLLRRVAEAGVPLAVGTRASIQEGADHATQDRELLNELGVASDQTMIVGRDPEALAQYVNLACDREQLSGDLRDLLVEDLCAPTVAATDQERQFLFVRLLVHELVARQRVGQNPDEAALELLEGNHRTVFAAAVARLRQHAPAAASLLEALAYARGAGLPRLGGIWELAASVVRGASVTPVDIDDTLPLLAPYVMLDAEDGRSVYRLAHRTFVEYFEQEWGDGREARELAVARGLIEAAEDSLAATHAAGRNIDTYLVSHLATHVAAAGTPGWQLLADHEPLLDVIDPRPVASEVMSSGIVGSIPLAIGSVAMGAHLLATCRPSDRSGVRQLVGAGVAGRLAAEPSASAAWWVRAAVRSRRPVHRTLNGHTDWVTGITTFTHHGRTLLATTSNDQTVRIWDPVSGRQVGEPLTGHTDRVSGITSFAHRGRRRLATTSHDQTVRVWDPDTGQQVGQPFVGHTSGVTGITSFTHHGRTLIATTSTDKTVRVWDPDTSQQVGQSLTGHTSQVTGITSFTHHGRTLLATTSGDRTVRIWDPDTSQQVGQPLTGHTQWVTGITSFTHDGRTLLATISWDRTVRIWDPDTRQQVGQPFVGHTSRVNGITSFTHRGRILLATTSWDQTLRVWDPNTGQQVGQPFVGHTSRVSGITSFTHRRRILLATTSWDRTVRIWDPDSGGQVGEPLTGHTNSVRGITSFTHRGRRPLLATTSDDLTVRIWDPVSGHEVPEPLTGHTSRVNGITSFTHHGRPLLATTSNDERVRVWDPDTGRQVGQSLTGHTGPVSGITSFTHHGRPLLATTSDDWTVRVWDPDTGRQVGQSLTGHTDGVSGITSFAQHGRPLLATTSDDWTVRVWDPDTGRQVGQSLTGHTDGVSGITSFAQHGRPLLATASDDQTVRVWDPENGSAVAVLRLHHRAHTLVALDDDLVVGLDDGWARIALSAELGFEPLQGVQTTAKPEGHWSPTITTPP